MKAIARLIFTYFTGTGLLRFITSAGLLAGIVGSALLLYFPPLTGGSGNPSRLSLAQEGLVFFFPSPESCASRSAHRCCRRCSRGLPRATTSTSSRTAARSCSQARSRRSR